MFAIGIELLQMNGIDSLTFVHSDDPNNCERWYSGKKGKQSNPLDRLPCSITDVAN